MMIMFRIVLAVALVSSSAVVSMQDMHKKEISVGMYTEEISIGCILNTITSPQSDFDDVKWVQLYLNNGGDINAKGTLAFHQPALQEMNLLMTSVLYGRPRLMKFLLKNGATLNDQNEYGDTALTMAAWFGRASLVHLLLNAGADPLVRNGYGVSALWCAENTPLRNYSFYTEGGKNHRIPRMINALKRAEGFAAQLQWALYLKQLVNSDDGRNNNIPKLMNSSHVVKKPVVQHQQRNQKRNKQHNQQYIRQDKMVNGFQLRIQQ